jgi:hypothetical protein
VVPSRIASRHLLISRSYKWPQPLAITSAVSHIVDDISRNAKYNTVEVKVSDMFVVHFGIACFQLAI